LPDIVLGVTEEEYELAGSKFITAAVPLTADNVGHTEYRNIELGLPFEKTAGKSVSFIGKIMDGVDEGKETEIVAGISKDPTTGKSGVWKLKEILRNIDVPVKMIDTPTGRKPSFDSTEVAGKKCTGLYQIQAGTKGGVPGAEEVYYPKLVSILPPGFKPVAEELL